MRSCIGFALVSGTRTTPDPLQTSTQQPTSRIAWLFASPVAEIWPFQNHPNVIANAHRSVASVAACTPQAFGRNSDELEELDLVEHQLSANARVLPVRCSLLPGLSLRPHLYASSA